MPGQYQHTLESIIPAVREAYEAGIRCIDLFGIPLDEDKDEIGSTAWDPQGILNRAIAVCREEFGDDLVVMADTCLDGFTSHGCGSGTSPRATATAVCWSMTATARSWWITTRPWSCTARWRFRRLARVRIPSRPRA